MTIACAHRGDVTHFRENTIAAIASAIDAGAAIVEIDVRVCEDGSVIVLHDRTLERMWGHASPAGDLPWATIAQLGYDDVRVPLLTEVLDLFRDSASTLMIDMDELAPADAAFDTVRQSGVEVIWCGNLEAMQRIRTRSADARIWMPWAHHEPPLPEHLAALRPEYVNAPHHVLSKGFVDTVHAQGLRVSAWTIDEEPFMRWAQHIGVDSVTTNRLGLLQSVLVDAPAAGTAATASPDIDRSLHVARVLAEWAVSIARNVTPERVLTKTHAADLVTAADRFIEVRVRETIAANLPGHVVVGEEFGGEPVSDAPCWYVDPIDGTTNFANHVPWHSCSIAMAMNDTPLVGVVGDAAQAVVYWAAAGRGAWRDDEALSVDDDDAPDDVLAGRVVLTELAAHQPWPGMLGVLGRLAERHCTMRIMGSATLTLVGVAASRGIGAVVHRFSPIDHLAATLIATEAGAVVTDITGREHPFPAFGGVLVATRAATSDLHRMWRSAVAEAAS